MFCLYAVRPKIGYPVQNKSVVVEYNSVVGPLRYLVIPVITSIIAHSHKSNKIARY